MSVTDAGKIWIEAAGLAARRCGASRRKPITDSWSRETVMLPSWDGTELETIIYRPVLEGAVPTVVCRTCYPEMDPLYEARAVEYCKRGFAYIVQYCRGIRNSGGKWEPNVNERADGKAFLDWVDSQEWVESIGYAGHSYLALTGWAIADIVPQKVRTMYLTHYGVFRHTSAYQDGLFRHDVLTGWAMGNAGVPITADYLESCRYRPQLTVDEDLWGYRLDWYRALLQSPEPDAEYWKTGFWGELAAIPGRVTIPIFMEEGWYDHHLGSALRTYRALPEETRRKSVFVIGAWNHGFVPSSGGHKGKNYDENDEARALDWFTDLLVDKTIPHGCVREYVIGEDLWRSYSDLPAGKAEHRFYLDGTDFSLRDEPPSGCGESVYRYDPDNPEMSCGGDSLLVSQERQGSLLQPDFIDDGSALCFTTEPLKEPLTFSGPIKAVLNVKSDAKDTAFMAKYIEVMPDGRAYNIRTAVTTLAFRNGSHTREDYTPGEPVRIEFNSWDVAWQLQKGSRLRVEFRSSDFPQYAIHSNYAGAWAEQRAARTALQTIIWGGENGSFISLPITEINKEE